MQREPTSRWLTEYNFYTHPCYVFLFQELETSVKGGHDGDENCHRGMGCPGASVQTLFCICNISKFISKQSSVLFVCRSKTLLEFKDFFFYFISKSLCAFVCCY